MSQGWSKIYEKRFLRKLKNKLDIKSEKFQDLKLNWDGIKYFKDFNQAFTFPVHGFKSEAEFNEQAKSDIYLEAIKIPTLIVNAKNDPMLGGRNFPYAYAEKDRAGLDRNPRN